MFEKSLLDLLKDFFVYLHELNRQFPSNAPVRKYIVFILQLQLLKQGLQRGKGQANDGEGKRQAVWLQQKFEQFLKSTKEPCL